MPEKFREQSKENIQQENFTDSILEEKEKRETRASLEFFFSAHQKEDYKELEKHIKDCDIFVPEVYGAEPDTEELLNDISHGKIKPGEYPDYSSRSRFFQLILNTIYGSGKAVMLADVSSKDKEFGDLEKMSDYVYDIEKFKKQDFINGKIDSAIKMQKDIQRGEELIMKIRNQCISRKINRILDAVGTSPSIDKYLKSKDKEEAKVLIQLGTAHASVFHEMSESHPGMQVDRHIYGGARVFSTGDEIGRRKEYGKKIDEKLYFQLLAQDIIRSFLPKVQDSNKTIWIMREIASHLSVEDVKSLSKAMGEKEGMENKLDAAEDFFKQNNIFIPKTEEEMDRMLKRYGKLPKEEKTESLNCSHCGTIAELGTDFCEQCGHKL